MRRAALGQVWRAGHVAAAMAVMVLVAGCSGGTGDAEALSPSTTTGAASDPLTGEWHTVIEPGDGTRPGRWTLRFDGARVALAAPDGSLGPGAAPYQKMPGQRIRFSTDPGCPDQQKVTRGVYRYRVSDGVLRFTEVARSDSCRPHALVLTSHPWRR